MNPNATSSRTLAFTLVEMLMVIAIIGILAAMLLPVLNSSEVRTKRVVCINGLQQIGLAFHVFSGDHNGKFPMTISTNDGGSLEFVQSGFEGPPVFYTAFRHFQTLSSELVRPQTVICPADMRAAATNFWSLQNENLSYFVGVESTFDKPYTILAGDRNLITNSFDQPTILQLGPWSRLAWSWEVHRFKGNVLIADGHVEQWNDSSMAAAGAGSPFNQSLYLPSIVPSELPFANGSPSGSSGSGSGGSSDSGSDSTGSGPAPSNPAGPDSAQLASSSSGNSNMNAESSSPQAESSSMGQPMPMMDKAYSEGYYATETVSQAQSPDQTLIARSVQPPAGASTDVVISVQDRNSAMSPFDQQMTIVLQHSFGWLYLLLCILVLLYLLNKLRKRLQKKEEK